MKDTRGQPSANDRFKRIHSRYVSIGFIMAVGAHWVFFTVFPDMQIADLRAAGGQFEAVALPPEPPKVDMPQPPEPIARPATPRVGQVAVADEITIVPTTFESNPPQPPGPPPRVGSNAGKGGPSFIPYDVAPRLKNGAEIRQILQREYPGSLAEAGLGGTVVLWILVNVKGQVVKSQVHVSSGRTEFDEAAQRVASAMFFQPAMNRDKKTAVWVQQAITFEVVTQDHATRSW